MFSLNNSIELFILSLSLISLIALMVLTGYMIYMTNLVYYVIHLIELTKLLSAKTEKQISLDKAYREFMKKYYEWISRYWSFWRKYISLMFLLFGFVSLLTSLILFFNPIYSTKVLSLFLILTITIFGASSVYLGYTIISNKVITPYILRVLKEWIEKEYPDIFRPLNSFHIRCEMIKVNTMNNAKIRVCHDIRKEDFYTILFIHGFPGRLEDFTGLIKCLEGRYNIVLFDLRGFGFSFKPKNINVENYIEDIETIVGTVGIDRTKLIVVGYSLGSLLALNYAIKQEVKALILIAPLYKIKPTIFLHKILLHPFISRVYLVGLGFLKLVRPLAILLLGPSLRRTIFKKVRNKLFIKEYARYLLSLPLYIWLYLRIFKQYYDSYNILGRIKELKTNNILLIVGSDDSITPRKLYAEPLEKEFKKHNKNTVLITVHDSAHDIIFEKPGMVCHEIIHFLSKL